MNGVDTLNSMIAIAMDGAATLAKGVDIIKDPRIKTLLSELAAERESMVAELRDEVRSLGGTPEDRGTVVGSAHRLYTEVKLALAPHDRRAVIEEIQRSEERVREKLQALLAEETTLSPAVRAITERHYDRVRRSCGQVNQLEFDTERDVGKAPARKRRTAVRRDITPTKEDIMTGKQRNEGEGNKTAAKEYNEATKKFTQSGQVDKQAEAAAKAREGAERQELDRAEQAGKSHAKGEDPQLHQRETAKTE